MDNAWFRLAGKRRARTARSTGVPACYVDDGLVWDGGRKDLRGNSWRREDVAVIHLRCGSSRLRHRFRLLFLYVRRRRHGDQGGDVLPRQSLETEQWDQNERQHNGGIEGKSRNHPAAAAGANSTCGFKCGVFKHGLPPLKNRFSRAGWELEAMIQTRAGRPLSRTNSAREAGAFALCPSEDQLSLEPEALRISQSEPLYLGRHRGLRKCSRSYKEKYAGFLG